MRPILTCLAVLTLGVALGQAPAPKDKPAPTKLYVPLGNGIYVQMRKKEVLKTVLVRDKAGDPDPEEGTLRVHRYQGVNNNQVHELKIGGSERVVHADLTLEEGKIHVFEKDGGKERHFMVIGRTGRDDPTTISLAGKALGTALLEMTALDGKKEVHEIVVRRELVLPEGVSYRFAMPGGGIITDAATAQNNTIRLVPADKPLAIVVHALAPGQETMTLKGPGEKIEVVEVFVRKVDKTITVGEKQRVQLASKKVIEVARLEDSRPLRLRSVIDDPTTVELEGLGVGATKLLLKGLDAKVEVIEVGIFPKKQ